MFARVAKSQKAHSYGISCELCGDAMALECGVSEHEASNAAWNKANQRGLWATHSIYPEMKVFACMRCVRAVVWAFHAREAKESE